MVSAVSQPPAPAAEGTESDITYARHWLQGRYFVPLPDLAEETWWEINQGRALPAFVGICALLHDLERRGTQRQKAAAIAGRIEHLGVTGLARAIGRAGEKACESSGADAKSKGASTKAILRQLRFLERRGLIRTYQGKFTAEVDPATGRIIRNYAKAPPKVIELTLTDRHYRPTGPVREPRRAGCETPQGPKAVGCETHPKAPKARVRNAPVSKDSDLQRDRSPLDSDRRQDASGPLGRPESPAAKANPSSGSARQTRDITAVSAAFDTNPAIPSRIADLLGLDRAEVASTPPGERRDDLIRRFYAKQGWHYDPATKSVSQQDHYAMLKASGEFKPAEGSRDRQTRHVLLQTYVANCARSLRLTEAEVIELGKADKGELVRRLEAAGADPMTGRRRIRPTEQQAEAQRQREAALADKVIRDLRTVTEHLSINDEPQEAADAFGPADDTLAREEAADGLREALATMSPAGRERARDLGEQIDEGDAEVATLKAAIEQKLAREREVAEATRRDLAELQDAKGRQSAMLAELAQGIARRQREG